MKDKNLAAVLAFFGGVFGLHRFYLGQIGLGILYCIFFPIASIIGVIDAIVLLSMDEETFDAKYNDDKGRNYDYRRTNRPTDRYERYRQRELDRQRRQRQRSATNQSPSNARRRREQQSRRGVSQKDLGPDRRKKGSAPGAARRANTHREAGIKYFKDYDYEAAIEALEKSIELNPRDIATHWNLACAYSLTEDVDKALYHIDRAVALGFSDFDRIRTHDALAYIRIQSAYLDFEKNDFRLAPEVKSGEAQPQQDDLLSQKPPDSDAPPRTNTDLLEQLQRLGELREKGLLTEEEFAAQKRKLLG
ncbi:MAG: NINE protein [Bacteroidota bacterium]